MFSQVFAGFLKFFQVFSSFLRWGAHRHSITLAADRVLQTNYITEQSRSSDHAYHSSNTAALANQTFQRGLPKLPAEVFLKVFRHGCVAIWMSLVALAIQADNFSFQQLRFAVSFIFCVVCQNIVFASDVFEWKAAPSWRYRVLVVGEGAKTLRLKNTKWHLDFCEVGNWDSTQPDHFRTSQSIPALPQRAPSPPGVCQKKIRESEALAWPPAKWYRSRSK